MAEQNAVPVEASQSLPERPKDDASAAEDGKKGPSKNELKKLAKEKAKAEKAAKIKAEEEARKKEADANDVSKADYGELPMLGSQPYTAPETKVERVSLAQLADKYSTTEPDENADIVFRAEVENARNQSAKLAFLVFRQGLSTIQAVVAASDTLSRQMVKFSGSIPSESVVLVTANVKKPFEPVKSTTIQNLEVHVKKLFIVAKADAQLPMQVADAERPIPAEGQEEQQADDGKPIVTLNTRLNNRVIDLRGKHNHAIFRIKDGITLLFQEFLRSKGFMGANTPRLLGAPSEGGASVFEVSYFATKAFLAQSPQLYKQMLIAARFERVMEVGPIFRAENSNTARHLTEFTGLDMEMAFEEDYHEVVTMLEELMLFIFNGLRERYKKESDLVRSIYQVEDFKLPEAGKVPRLHFKEGIQMLRDDGVEIGDFDDLSTPDEKRLGALVLKKYGSDFYVLDQFPLAIRPFYTMPSAETQAAYDPKNPNAGYSNSYDFFMRGQEIMSGAQRIHDAAFLEKRMREHVTPVDSKSDGLRDYVNAFRYGCPPHAGGGIGLERIVMLWLGLPNVRLASLFPRDPSRLLP
ncbi:aspartate--trna ligase, cytoplasmic [Acrodontium crateriforme]|uniref:Probable aspartate--tRNA ligase, cytoplasmic n=1 Tax=Acrodontium crateriforme TaxID=150365 RepID=A0AAQ3R531_9PEZI|nr:aspartate--trna ligase, cytoplasmic [Acrodontium crateriforme]